MKFAYYPGCSARSTCAELNVAMHRVAQKLGLNLVQLDSATCTGARELRAIDPAGFYALNVRILALAEREGLPLMTICNTCTLNLLDAHAAFVSDADLASSVNAGLGEEGLHYSGRTKISVYLAPTDVAALVGLGTSFGGLGAAVGIGLALGTTAAVAGPLAIAATVAVSLGWAGAGTWVAMRGIWRRVARRWEERANRLGTQLVAAAQRAIDAARTGTE